MTGTAAGGKIAAQKNLARNPNFYKEIGRRGGLVKTPGSGFASMTTEEHKAASAKGGFISRRVKKK